MSSTGKYRNIRSFKDFEDEKLQLHYNIRIAEKKLQLTLYNIRTHFSLEKVLYNLLLTNVVDPLFLSVKNMVAGFFGRLRQKVTPGSKKKYAEVIEE